MSPWDILGWLLVVWIGSMVLLKGAIIALDLYPRLRSLIRRYVRHLRTRNIPPATGQLWDQRGSNLHIKGVYDNGRICWGSHKVSKASVNNIERVWQMFFGTAFNEHIATKKCKSYPDNVLDLLRQLSREEATTFPHKELGKADMVSVDLCIDRLLKYGGD